jgi:Nitrogen permease regulator 2
MSEDHPKSSSAAQSPVGGFPAPPDDTPPPPPKDAPMRTPELSSASPSILSRKSSITTTPRQHNRRVMEERKIPSKLIIGSSPKIPTTPASHPLPTPRQPSKCPLLCCFYAEFDIKVGPKICYQSPANFMEQDIRLTVQQMERLLADAFDATDGSVPSTPRETKENDEDSSLPSIFDSCSEYIITGNELTGNIINLSTHHIHVLTRPTSIADEKYERNSLLFCVGFVLRRTEDPRPFRPVLSKLALTLRDMEVESQFLSHSRPQIQTLLQGILVSLNSEACECNLLLGKADVLNLKLFRPPKTPALPVKDHAVPILLRRDRQVQAVRAWNF